MKRKAVVIGNPISHSKSPRLHNHWLHRLGIDGVYERIEAPLDGFQDTVETLSSQGVVGANVTIPFKEQAYEIADHVDELTREMQAANTLVFRDDTLSAKNTDGYGFGSNILDVIPDWQVKGHHIILGAGGAARAIMIWLLRAGGRVTIINRSKPRAMAMVSGHDGAGIATLDELPELMKTATSLINATSRGMNGENDWQIDFSHAHHDMIVNDIVYTPLETGLLRQAKRAKLRTVDGLGMLIWQARPGFEAWFGGKPEIDTGIRNLMLSKKIIGLTGSIGIGKSTVAAMFEKLGADVWDADAAVKKLYQTDGELMEFVMDHCPAAIDDNSINKTIWREFVLQDSEVLRTLEQLIHRKIEMQKCDFLESPARVKLCDIPLLFETGQEARFDCTIAVIADEVTQRNRVLDRGTMTPEQFEVIKAKQMPSEEKAKRADFVIRTDIPIDETQANVRELMQEWGLINA